MIEKFLFCTAAIFVFLSFTFAEETVHYKIPVDVVINQKAIPAGNYSIRVDSNTLQIAKGETVLGSQKAIVLPARGEGKTSVTEIKAGKHSYVRIRFREEDRWFIVYLKVPKPLPDTQHSELSSQN